MNSFIKNLTVIGTLTVITVFSWIGFNIYHNLNSSEISEKTFSAIKPIVPIFDQESLNSLTTRQIIEINLSDTIKITPKVTPSESPTPTPTPATQTTPTLSPTPTLTQNPTASATPTP